MFVENGAAFLMRRDTENIKTVAVSKSTPNLNSRLDDDIPDGAKTVEYASTDEAKQAVVDGTVDAAFIYSYDAEYTVNMDMSGNLAFTVAPEDPIEIRAVMLETGDHTLMSILMKCLNNFPATDRTAITSKYVSFTVTDVSIADYMTIHPTLTAIVVIVLALIIFVVIFMILRHNAEQRHREELEDKVNEITLLNAQLNLKQRKLEDTTEEQEAQLEEIRQLNEEQVAQLEEITALNTELEDRQDKLEKARDMAEAANNAKTSFLFSMSHDIRTPMNAIIGFTDLLDKYQEDAGRRADYLQKIKDSSSVLLSIINNVLEMARIEKGTVILESVAVSVNGFMDSMYTVFEDMMNQKSLEFTKDVNVEHRYVYCDPIKLREVLIISYLTPINILSAEASA
jgi:signal transduction histidine kinase